MIVVLDTAPLGMVTNPRASAENDECKEWLRALLTSGALIVIPEICDYELRRELLRANKTNGIARLDALKNAIEYLPLDTLMMLAAAELWARARQTGKPSAPDTALDGDMILAAQTLSLETRGEKVFVATTNIRHLEDFVDAREWKKIS